MVNKKVSVVGSVVYLNPNKFIINFYYLVLILSDLVSISYWNMCMVRLPVQIQHTHLIGSQ